MTEQTPVALLSFIRGAETRHGYQDYYSGSVLAPPKPVTTMTVREVQDWQKASVRAGSKSSAVGGYQIISKTFNGLVDTLGLTGDELFDEPMQDRMGSSLLAGRGFNEWQAGKLSDQKFANNLAHEWAALPTASGRSAYAGDGLNASTVSSTDLFGALTATRNGEQVDLSGFGAGGPSNPTYAAGAEAAAAKGERISHIVPGETSGGLSIVAEASTPAATSFRSDREDVLAQRAADANTPGLWEGAGMAMDEQWIATNMLRQFGQEDFAPDPKFQFNEELWGKVTEGLPENYHEVFGGAVSEQHAMALAASTRESFRKDAGMAQLGWTGIGLNFGAALLDPVSIAATAATEGTLGPVIYGAKLTKLARVLRAGTAAAVVNTGIDGYLISQDPIGEWENLAYSAAAGFVLGGAIGAFRKSPVDGELASGFNKWIKGKDAEIAPAPVAPMAAPDGSMGAARVPGSGPALSPAEVIADRFADAPKSATPFNLPRIDMSGSLKQSENGITRRIAAGMGEDGVGNADGSVNMVAADIKSARLIRTTEARTMQVYNPAFKAWAKEKGFGAFKRLTDPALRAEFSNAVGFAVRRPLDAAANAHVQKAAAKIKEEYAALLKYGKEQNIKGFEEIKDSDLYLTRSHNIQAIDDMVGRWGSGPVHQLVAKSLMSGDRKYRAINPGKLAGKAPLEYTDALGVAKAYIKSVRSRKYGSFDMNRALAGHDMETLKGMLDDAGLDASEVARISDAVRFTRDNADQGRIGAAQFRLNLDEGEFMPAYDLKTGQKGEIKIEDMLDNDAENLFTHYAHSVIRTGQMEEVLSAFKVPDGLGQMPAHAPSYETVKGYIADSSKLSKDAQRDEFAKLDTLYKAVKGIPQEPETVLRTYLERVRSFNFIRVMNQSGVAQVSELGNILGQGGMASFFKHMPMLRKLSKGGYSEQLMDEIESIWGYGTDIIRHSPSIRMDDGGGTSFLSRGGSATNGQQVDFLLEQGKHATAMISGMAPINRMLQRFNGRVLVQRFLDHAQGGREINMRRFKSLGIDEAMADNISSQIRKHTSHSRGLLGRTVKGINIEKWDDIDAKNAFINGVDSWARKSIQENHPGNMPAFMTKELGKTIGQFRSFMLGAYTKQLLTGMHQKDWDTAASFMGTMFFGGLAYMAQTQFNSIGRVDRDEWLADKMSPESVGLASFQRAGFSSFLPMLVDAGVAPFRDEPIFAFRSTGLSTGIFGNPSVDLMDNIAKAGKGIIASASRSDYDFSQQDWRALTSITAFQNAFVIRNFLAAVGGELPRFSQ